MQLAMCLFGKTVLERSPILTSFCFFCFGCMMAASQMQPSSAQPSVISHIISARQQTAKQETASHMSNAIYLCAILTYSSILRKYLGKEDCKWFSKDLKQNYRIPKQRTAGCSRRNHLSTACHGMLRTRFVFSRSSLTRLFLCTRIKIKESTPYVILALSFDIWMEYYSRGMLADMRFRKTKLKSQHTTHSTV